MIAGQRAPFLAASMAAVRDCGHKLQDLSSNSKSSEMNVLDMLQNRLL